MAGLAVMGVIYLAAHRLIWGGWTVYASGDHFQRSGEFGVMGFDPDYAGRAFRLLGLLADRGYGLAAWQPAWLLVVPALGFALAGRRTYGPLLLLPLAAGWLTATFVALTMHGHWWPGRQLVVVLPLALILVLAFLTRARPLRWAALGLGTAGLVTYAWLIADGLAGRVTWISRFEETGSPVHRALRPLLPDYRHDFWPLHLVWLALCLLAIVHTFRRSSHRRST